VDSVMVRPILTTFLPAKCKSSINSTDIRIGVGPHDERNHIQQAMSRIACHIRCQVPHIVHFVFSSVKFCKHKINYKWDPTCISSAIISLLHSINDITNSLIPN
jgi:hypothetical protein